MYPGTEFKFDSPAGWQLCRQILKERLPFSPHDYQLEGVTAILDRRDFIGVSATGSGKSAYAYMVLHIIQGLQAQPTLCPSVKFPHDSESRVKTRDGGFLQHHHPFGSRFDMRVCVFDLS